MRKINQVGVRQEVMMGLFVGTENQIRHGKAELVAEQLWIDAPIADASQLNALRVDWESPVKDGVWRPLYWRRNCVDFDTVSRNIEPETYWEHDEEVSWMDAEGETYQNVQKDDVEYVRDDKDSVTEIRIKSRG